MWYCPCFQAPTGSGGVHPPRIRRDCYMRLGCSSLLFCIVRRFSSSLSEHPLHPCVLAKRFRVPPTYTPPCLHMRMEGYRRILTDHSGLGAHYLSEFTSFGSPYSRLKHLLLTRPSEHSVFQNKHEPC